MDAWTMQVRQYRGFGEARGCSLTTGATPRSLVLPFNVELSVILAGSFCGRSETPQRRSPYAHAHRFGGAFF